MVTEAPEQIRARLPGGFQLPPFGIHQFLALITVSIALWALGAVWLGLQGAQQWVGSWQGQVKVHIYLQDVPAEKRGELSERLKGLQGIAAVEAVSREKAAEWMRGWLGDVGVDIDVFAQRLPDALEISLLNERPEFLLADIEDEARRAGAVVNEDELHLVNAHEIVEQLKTLAWFATLVLALAMALIVSNTLRMILLARADEIYLMRLMGAKEWFVRMPFVLEGVLLGGSAGLLAWLLLWPLALFMADWLGSGAIYFQALLLLLPLAAGGAVVGSLGALVATARLVATDHAEGQAA